MSQSIAPAKQFVPASVQGVTIAAPVDPAIGQLDSTIDEFFANPRTGMARNISDKKAHVVICIPMDDAQSPAAKDRSSLLKGFAAEYAIVGKCVAFVRVDAYGTFDRRNSTANNAKLLADRIEPLARVAVMDISHSTATAKTWSGIQDLLNQTAQALNAPPEAASVGSVGIPAQIASAEPEAARQLRELSPQPQASHPGDTQATATAMTGISLPTDANPRINGFFEHREPGLLQTIEGKKADIVICFSDTKIHPMQDASKQLLQSYASDWTSVGKCVALLRVNYFGSPGGCDDEVTQAPRIRDCILPEARAVLWDVELQGTRTRDGIQDLLKELAKLFPGQPVGQGSFNEPTNVFTNDKDAALRRLQGIFPQQLASSATDASTIVTTTTTTATVLVAPTGTTPSTTSASGAALTATGTAMAAPVSPIATTATTAAAAKSNLRFSHSSGLVDILVFMPAEPDPGGARADLMSELPRMCKKRGLTFAVMEIARDDPGLILKEEVIRTDTSKRYFSSNAPKRRKPKEKVVTETVIGAIAEPLRNRVSSTTQVIMFDASHQSDFGGNTWLSSGAIDEAYGLASKLAVEKKVELVIGGLRKVSSEPQPDPNDPTRTIPSINFIRGILDFVRDLKGDS
jgi:hypothetical protein